MTITVTRWWFQIFFMFTPKIREMIPNLTVAYFSNGLVQPPTRWHSPSTRPMGFTSTSAEVQIPWCVTQGGGSPRGDGWGVVPSGQNRWHRYRKGSLVKSPKFNLLVGTLDLGPCTFLLLYPLWNSPGGLVQNGNDNRYFHGRKSMGNRGEIGKLGKSSTQTCRLGIC